MKKNDLKRHLKDYSIYAKRSSTISHAFASALSVADDYDVNKIEFFHNLYKLKFNVNATQK